MLKAVAERTVLPNTLQFHRSLEQMRQNVVFFFLILLGLKVFA